MKTSQAIKKELKVLDVRENILAICMGAILVSSVFIF